jgi:hypothetical protein
MELLAGRLWSSRIRVGFGVSWSPAVPDADVMVGCGGAREELVRVLSGGVLSEAERVGTG